MSKIKYISMLVFLFIPAYSQLLPERQAIKADTTRLFNELYQIRLEKKVLVDSIEALMERIDSAENPEKKYYVWKVDIYRLDGVRERWNFIYLLREKDTVFQRVKKTYTKYF